MTTLHKQQVTQTRGSPFLTFYYLPYVFSKQRRSRGPCESGAPRREALESDGCNPRILNREANKSREFHPPPSAACAVSARTAPGPARGKRTAHSSGGDEITARSSHSGGPRTLLKTRPTPPRHATPCFRVRERRSRVLWNKLWVFKMRFTPVVFGPSR